MATSFEFKSIIEKQRLAEAECNLGLVRDLYLSPDVRSAVLADHGARRAPARRTYP